MKTFKAPKEKGLPLCFVFLFHDSATFGQQPWQWLGDSSILYVLFTRILLAEDLMGFINTAEVLTHFCFKWCNFSRLWWQTKRPIASVVNHLTCLNQSTSGPTRVSEEIHKQSQRKIVIFIFILCCHVALSGWKLLLNYTSSPMLEAWYTSIYPP